MIRTLPHCSFISTLHLTQWGLHLQGRGDRTPQQWRTQPTVRELVCVNEPAIRAVAFVVCCSGGISALIVSRGRRGEILQCCRRLPAACQLASSSRPHAAPAYIDTSHELPGRARPPVFRCSDSSPRLENYA